MTEEEAPETTHPQLSKAHRFKQPVDVSQVGKVPTLETAIFWVQEAPFRRHKAEDLRRHLRRVCSNTLHDARNATKARDEGDNGNAPRLQHPRKLPRRSLPISFFRKVIEGTKRESERKGAIRHRREVPRVPDGGRHAIRDAVLRRSSSSERDLARREIHERDGVSLRREMNSVPTRPSAEVQNSCSLRKQGLDFLYCSLELKPALWRFQPTGFVKALVVCSDPIDGHDAPLATHRLAVQPRALLAPRVRMQPGWQMRSVGCNR